ncbi:MAG TPA: hypothetical protein VH985_13935, partial [Candidatus Binatia bacterium]
LAAALKPKRGFWRSKPRRRADDDLDESQGIGSCGGNGDFSVDWKQALPEPDERLASQDLNNHDRPRSDPLFKSPDRARRSFLAPDSSFQLD